MELIHGQSRVQPNGLVQNPPLFHILVHIDARSIISAAQIFRFLRKYPLKGVSEELSGARANCITNLFSAFFEQLLARILFLLSGIILFMIGNHKSVSGLIAANFWARSELLGVNGIQLIEIFN